MLKWLRIRWLVGRFYRDNYLCNYYHREIKRYLDKYDDGVNRLEAIVAELEELGCK